MKLSKSKENISLSGKTTFKIGGPARYFLTAKTKGEIIEAVKKAKEINLPFFILGGGSNVLALDGGFPGIVIKIRNTKYRTRNTEIHAGAGKKLGDLVKLAARDSLTGLEWAAGIPGTLGGAIYGNSQAFNQKMSEAIKEVEVFDSRTGRVKNFSQKQCRLRQKDSVFKNKKNLIILSAVLQLKKGDKKEIQKKIKENLAYRKKNHPLNFPSAGSVFLNSQAEIKDPKLLKEFPELKEFNKKKYIPSAFLIEKSGLKGKKMGGAMVSKKHAGFIVNLKKAKAKDVLNLIQTVKKEVKKKFGVDLKEEIETIS